MSIYTMDKSTKRSLVHKHSKKIQALEDGSNTAKCIHCNTKLKSASGGITSNTSKHLGCNYSVL